MSLMSYFWHFHVRGYDTKFRSSVTMCGITFPISIYSVTFLSLVSIQIIKHTLLKFMFKHFSHTSSQTGMSSAEACMQQQSLCFFITKGMLTTLIVEFFFTNNLKIAEYFSHGL